MQKWRFLFSFLGYLELPTTRPNLKHKGRSSMGWVWGNLWAPGPWSNLRGWGCRRRGCRGKPPWQ